MRWIIGLLVLANLAIFAWSQLQQKPPVTGRLAEPGVGNIRLLREMDTVPAADTGSEVAMIQAAEAPAPMVLTLPVAQEGGESAVESPSEAAAKPVAAMGQAAPEIEPEPEPVVPPARPEMHCGRLAEFRDKAGAEQLLEKLKARGIEGEIGSQSREVTSGYWVLIPPVEDREAGKRKLEELKAAGIKDVWLFAKGPMKNAISLGLYSSEENAKRRAGQVKTAGFGPVIEPKVGESEFYWIDYRAKQGAKVLTPGLGQAADIQDRPRECPQASPPEVE